MDRQDAGGQAIILSILLNFYAISRLLAIEKNDLVASIQSIHCRSKFNALSEKFSLAFQSQWIQFLLLLLPFALQDNQRRPHFDQMTLVQAAAATILVEPAKQIPITDDDGEGNDEELPSCNCAAFLIKIG